MKYVMIFSLSLILFFTGCNTRRSSQTTNTNTAHNTALNTAVRQHDEQISKLTFQFNQVRESNKTLVNHINKLIKEVALLKRKIATLEQANINLSDQLNAEKALRQSEIDKLLKEVAKQTAAAMNARKNNTSSTSNTKKTGTPPIGKGEFYEYKVQPGATLGAIAKAYKVSVSDIKKANNLKSDMIRVGQKLYIPKK